jgi:hypothetical protein
MGKVALITVLGLIIVLGFFNNVIKERSFEAVSNMSGYYSSVTAKNIARSAMENYLKKLYRNRDLRGTFTEQDTYVEGGVDTLTIQSDSSTTSIGDTVRVSVVAHYGGERSSIEAILLGTSFNIPPVTAAIAFPGPNPELDLGGVPLIDGSNHDENGNPSSSCDSLPGVAVASGSDSANMVNELLSDNEEDHVIGLGSDPSVHVRDTPDPSTYVEPIISNADFYLPSGVYTSTEYGTQANPVILYGKGDLKFSGGIVGHGLLIIDGTLELSGNFFWYGLVIVIGPNPEIFNSVGTNRIVGGVILGGPDKQARMRGNADIQYSCETLENMRMNTDGLITFNMLSWYE